MNFKEWYAGRSPQERRTLGWGGLAVAVLVLVGGLLQLQASVAAADKRVADKRGDLAWMQAVTPRMQATPAGRSDEPLPLLVDRTARDSGLGSTLAGVEPAAAGGLRVRFEAASFDAIVVWLARVQQERGLVVESASVDGTDTAGLVNANIVLRAP